MSVQGGSTRHFGDARFGQLNFDQASSAIKNKPLGTSVLSMGKMGSFNLKQTSVNGLPKTIHKQTSVLSEMSDFNGQGFM